jgi:sugar-specific transcriptional regulator TrmB
MHKARTGGRRGSLDGIDPLVAEGLTYLGLTAYEIRVYHAILEHPHSRVPEIARFAKVPQPKVYATLKRRLERGLCQSHLGPINQYSAIEPKEGFGHLVEEARLRQAEAMRAIEALQERHDDANQGMSRREGRVKLFQGRPAAGRDFKELMSGAKQDVAVIVRFPLVVGDYMEEVHRLLEAGGRVRLLCEMPTQLEADQQEFVDNAIAAGAEMRRIAEVPMRMGIFDHKILILPMDDPSAEQGDGFMMLEVRNPSLSESFVEVFDMLWKKGRKI